MPYMPVLVAWVRWTFCRERMGAGSWVCRTDRSTARRRMAVPRVRAGQAIHVEDDDTGNPMNMRDDGLADAACLALYGGDNHMKKETT